MTDSASAQAKCRIDTMLRFGGSRGSSRDKMLVAPGQEPGLRPAHQGALSPGCSAEHHASRPHPGGQRLSHPGGSRSPSIAIRFPSLRSRPGRSVATEETPESRAPPPASGTAPRRGAASPHSRSHMTRAPPMVVQGAERSPSVRHLRAEVASLANVS